MGSETECDLGVVDLSDENIMKPGSKEWISACRVVRLGLEQHGCFIALYDKADRGFCNSMISAMNHLFDLPLETKMQETNPKIFHSYYSQYPLLPLYESLGIDDPLTMEGIQKFAHIIGLRKMVSESYDLDKERCDSFVESNNYLLRCFKYRKAEMHEADLGIHAHTDMSLLTILHLQLNPQVRIVDHTAFR